MKILIETLRMPPLGWRLELELEKESTVADLKARLGSLADGPRITPKTRVLGSAAAGQFYTLRDQERLMKKVLLMDTTQEVSTDVPAASPAAPSSAASPAAQSSAATAMSAAAKVGLAASPAPARGLGAAAATAAGATAARQMAAAAAQSSSTASAPVRQLPRLPPATPASSSTAPAFRPGTRAPAAATGLEGIAADPAMQQRMLKKLVSQWPMAEAHRALGSAAFAVAGGGPAAALRVLRDLPSLLPAFAAGEVDHATKVAFQAFEGRTDLFRTHRSGTACINEHVLQMANNYYQLLRPLLGKNGFPETVAGFAQMDSALRRQAEVSPEAAAAYLRLLSAVCFGASEKPPPEEAAIAPIIFAGMMSLSVPVLTVHTSYLQHLALSPLERRLRSAQRTAAWVELLLQQQLSTLKLPSGRRLGSKRHFWLLGVSPASLGEGLGDAGAFTEREVELRCVGEGLQSRARWSCASNVQAESLPFGNEDLASVPEGTLVFCLNTGVGALDHEALRTWLPRLAELLANPGVGVVMTCRSEAEALCETAVLRRLGAKSFLHPAPLSYVRNIFSAMAGSPDIDFDENGWWMAYRGRDDGASPAPAAAEALLNDLPSLVASVNASIAASEEAAESAATSTEGAGEEQQLRRGGSRSPVSFWGILDLKYDPSKPPQERVRVLETGDGRSSKFSGYGAAIKENFEKEQRLEETIRCAVLTENKKLTHDTVVECGYAHLRPTQRIYPKAYTDDLAGSIRSDFGLAAESSMCILKLCNRTRGAGVVPVAAGDLDKVLCDLLCPPENMEDWLRLQPKDWFKKIENGCFEEQRRHWWSNECPVFIVEELCVSAPTVREDGRRFDGTMRVGFCLHKEQRDRLPQGVLSTPEGLVSVGEDGETYPVLDDEGRPLLRPKPWDDDRPYMDLFRPGEMSLRLRWLGGYWKLPLEDDASEDLRGKIVSVAKMGTAPVDAMQLNDVYTTLGDMVSILFNSNTHSLSHLTLSRKYGDNPEFAAFVSSRLAASMRLRDRQRAAQILDLAQQPLARRSGPCKDLVLSYIQRNRAIFEAMYLRWESAESGFRKALESMPMNATARYLVGLARLEAEDWRGAEASFCEALLLDPDFKAPYVNLAVSLLRQGRFAEAAEACQFGLARHPQTPHASYNLGLARFALLHNDPLSVPAPSSTTPAEVLSVSEAPACAEEAEEGTAGGEATATAGGAGGGGGLGGDDLRSLALEAFEASREARTQSQLWSEQDEAMVSLLRSGIPLPRRPRSELPHDGWKLINWRP